MKTIARSLQSDAVVGDPLLTPWPSLNKILNLHTKELAVVAGAPGAGKSVFALNFAMGLDHPVLYCAMDRPTSAFARAAALALRAEISWVYETLRDEDGKAELLKELEYEMPNFLINPGALPVQNTYDRNGEKRAGRWNGLEERLIALGELYGNVPLVILDNLIDLEVPGYTHTDVGFYASSFGPLKQMAIRHNTCIMALHHVTRNSDGDKTGLGTTATEDDGSAVLW